MHCSLSLSISYLFFILGRVVAPPPPFAPTKGQVVQVPRVYTDNHIAHPDIPFPMAPTRHIFLGKNENGVAHVVPISKKATPEFNNMIPGSDEHFLAHPVTVKSTQLRPISPNDEHFSEEQLKPITDAIQASHRETHSTAATENHRARDEALKTSGAALAAHDTAVKLSATAELRDRQRLREDATHYKIVAGDFNVDAKKLDHYGKEHEIAAVKDFQSVQTSREQLSFRALPKQLSYHPPPTIPLPRTSVSQANSMIPKAQDAARKAQEYVQSAQVPSSSSPQAEQDSGLNKPGKHNRDDTNLGGEPAAKHPRSR